MGRSMTTVPEVYYARDVNRFTEEDSRFVSALPSMNVGVKVGLTAMHAFDQSGRSVANNVRKCVAKAGGDVIWDAKLDDIPSQIVGAVRGIVSLEVAGFTVKASGGVSMMKAALAARDTGFERLMAHYKADQEANELKNIPPPRRPILFGVTVLSSSRHAHDEDGENGEHAKESVIEKVLRYAARVERAGCDGLVCPGAALAAVKDRYGDRFKTLVTGIRPPWATWIVDDDQHLTITHVEAATLGADYVVIGRPVYLSKHPAETLARVQLEMEHRIGPTALSRGV